MLIKRFQRLRGKASSAGKPNCSGSGWELDAEEEHADIVGACAFDHSLDWASREAINAGFRVELTVVPAAPKPRIKPSARSNS
ncbi:MAG: hypothetical protein RPR28_08280 [Cycloclasticus sp.]